MRVSLGFRQRGKNQIQEEQPHRNSKTLEIMWFYTKAPHGTVARSPDLETRIWSQGQVLSSPCLGGL